MIFESYIYWEFCIRLTERSKNVMRNQVTKGKVVSLSPDLFQISLAVDGIPFLRYPWPWRSPPRVSWGSWWYLPALWAVMMRWHYSVPVAALQRPKGVGSIPWCYPKISSLVDVGCFGYHDFCCKEVEASDPGGALECGCVVQVVLQLLGGCWCGEFPRTAAALAPTAGVFAVSQAGEAPRRQPGDGVDGKKRRTRWCLPQSISYLAYDMNGDGTITTSN